MEDDGRLSVPTDGNDCDVTDMETANGWFPSQYLHEYDGKTLHEVVDGIVTIITNIKATDNKYYKAYLIR